MCLILIRTVLFLTIGFTDNRNRNYAFREKSNKQNKQTSIYWVYRRYNFLFKNLKKNRYIYSTKFITGLNIEYFHNNDYKVLHSVKLSLFIKNIKDHIRL